MEENTPTTEDRSDLIRGFDPAVLESAQHLLHEQIQKQVKAQASQSQLRTAADVHRSEAARLREEMHAALEESNGVVSSPIKSMKRKIREHLISAEEDEDLANEMEPTITKLKLEASETATLIDGWRIKYSRRFFDQEAKAATAAVAKRIRSLIKFEAQRRRFDESPDLRILFGDDCEAWVLNDLINLLKVDLSRPDLDPDPLPKDDVRVLELLDIGNFKPATVAQMHLLKTTFNL